MAKLLFIIILLAYTSVSNNPFTASDNTNNKKDYVTSAVENGELSPTPTPEISPITKTSEIKNSSNKTEKSDNEKETAYNTHSDKVIGEVSTNATKNSNSLVSCEDNPSFCEVDNKIKITPFPTPQFTPIPTYKPEPTALPSPTPTICVQKDVVCPKIACFRFPDAPNTDNGCGCTCPPPVY